MDVLPEDRSVLPSYNSDICNRHLFISNLTEDFFLVLKDTFIMDYKSTLKLQSLPEDMEVVTQEPVKITNSESDEVLKGSFLYMLLMIVTCQFFIHFFCHFFLKVHMRSCQFTHKGLLSVKSSVAQSF